MEELNYLIWKNKIICYGIIKLPDMEEENLNLILKTIYGRFSNNHRNTALSEMNIKVFFFVFVFVLFFFK